jgi:quercetin dioxygenase-like cupin family protein
MPELSRPARPVSCVADYVTATSWVRPRFGWWYNGPAVSTPLTPKTAGGTTEYVVAGGNHVSIALDRSESNDLLDVIEVPAAPGGGPPPHRHAFDEWFRVLDGELTFTEERDGVMRATHTLVPGGSVFVAPWIYHGTLNLTDRPCRRASIAHRRLVGHPLIDPDQTEPPQTQRV